MAMRFLTDINLLQSELQNAVIQVLATNPANGKQGQIYYNSVDNLLYRYDGTQWGPVGVVYNQSSATGAVVTGLGADGAVTTTNVTGLTLTGYTPVESGYVTSGMTMQQAFAALDEAVKNAAILQAVALGIDAKTIPYILKMADFSSAVDQDGKISEESLKNALNKVLEDVPALKPQPASQSGFLQVGASGNGSQGTNNEEALKKAFGL